MNYCCLLNQELRRKSDKRRPPKSPTNRRVSERRKWFVQFLAISRSLQVDHLDLTRPARQTFYAAFVGSLTNTWQLGRKNRIQQRLAVQLASQTSQWTANPQQRTARSNGNQCAVLHFSSVYKPNGWENNRKSTAAAQPPVRSQKVCATLCHHVPPRANVPSLG